MLIAWPAIRARSLSHYEWQVICIEVACLQGALWFASMRLSYPELSFWEGACVVAASMSTGWIYVDLVVGGLSVLLFLFAADAIALSPKPQLLFYQLVRLCVRNRLRQ